METTQRNKRTYSGVLTGKNSATTPSATAVAPSDAPVVNPDASAVIKKNNTGRTIFFRRAGQKDKPEDNPKDNSKHKNLNRGSNAISKKKSTANPSNSITIKVNPNLPKAPKEFKESSGEAPEDSLGDWLLSLRRKTKRKGQTRKILKPTEQFEQSRRGRCEKDRGFVFNNTREMDNVFNMNSEAINKLMYERERNFNTEFIRVSSDTNVFDDFDLTLVSSLNPATRILIDTLSIDLINSYITSNNSKLNIDLNSNDTKELNHLKYSKLLNSFRDFLKCQRTGANRTFNKNNFIRYIQDGYPSEFIKEINEIYKILKTLHIEFNDLIRTEEDNDVTKLLKQLFMNNTDEVNDELYYNVFHRVISKAKKLDELKNSESDEGTNPSKLIDILEEYINHNNNANFAAFVENTIADYVYLKYEELRHILVEYITRTKGIPLNNNLLTDERYTLLLKGIITYIVKNANGKPFATALLDKNNTEYVITSILAYQNMRRATRR
jgi:hypothetical protein